MPENMNYATTSDLDKLRIKLFGNDVQMFEGDIGMLGKLESRVARIERIIYAVGIVLVLLQFAQPYLEKAFSK